MRNKGSIETSNYNKNKDATNELFPSCGKESNGNGKVDLKGEEEGQERCGWTK